MSIDWNDGTGSTPIKPRPIPKLPEQPYKEPAQWSWSLPIGGGLLLITVACVSWMAGQWFGGCDPIQRDIRTTDNAGEYYVMTVASEFANACDVVIAKAESGQFNGLGDVEKTWNPLQKAGREKALEPFKAEVFDVLAEDFSNEKVVEMFSELKRGYRKVIDR